MHRFQALLVLLTSLGLVGCGQSNGSKTAAGPSVSPAQTSSAGSSTITENSPAAAAIPQAVDVTSEAATPSDSIPLAKVSTPVATAEPATTEVTQDAKPAAQPAKPKRQPIYDEKADAKALIAAAVNRARIEHKRVLIEWGGNWCGWCYKLHDMFKWDDAGPDGAQKDYQAVSDLVQQEFELVLSESRSNGELLKKYGGKDGSFSFPHLTILDDAGEVLTNQNTEPLEDGPKHDPVKVAEFLKKWSLEQVDAEVLLSAALKQAAEEDKSVFLQAGTQFCGWCKVLSRFIDAHKETFARDYVYLKIDYLRMKHGDEVAKRFQPEKNPGDPWMVILDPTGKVLISSVGPMGNTGYPSEPSEIDHFLSMLTATRKRLTDSDLDLIRKDLNVAREERLKRQAAAK
jgi:thioredoxin-related protein